MTNFPYGGEAPGPPAGLHWNSSFRNKLAFWGCCREFFFWELATIQWHLSKKTPNFGRVCKIFWELFFRVRRCRIQFRKMTFKMSKWKLIIIVPNIWCFGSKIWNLPV